MIKRISVLLLLLALSMTALFGCSQTKETKHASAIINTDKTNKEENLTPVTLNEVAHSIFYAPMYVAIEKGYFEEKGINLNLVTGFGADKTMTAVISGTADIGFMGSEASIYAYNEGANDYVVNFAQLTQRAGNFLVAREEIPDFHWTDLKDKKVLGGRMSDKCPPFVQGGKSALFSSLAARFRSASVEDCPIISSMSVI